MARLPQHASIRQARSFSPTSTLVSSQVVLKYLLASDAASEAILPVLSSVLQFSPIEIEQLRTARSSAVEEAASYFTTALFGGAPPSHASSGPQKALSTNAHLPSTTLLTTRAATMNGNQITDASAMAAEIDELKGKVARLKRLLGVANSHLSRLHGQVTPLSSVVDGS